VKVNCAALAETLLESELFGHEPGAFTGAERRHIGRFERADGGTLFLDEVASASMRVQEQILRVIEYGEFERVGGSEVLTTDVRIVAAANVDLPGQVRAGKFRADLLDRLAFEVITLPPLRVRWEDIPVLAQHFAQRMSAELGRAQFAGFGMDAMRALMDYAWPGNVRELKNVVERAVYQAASSGALPVERVEIDPFDSPWRPDPASAPVQDAAGDRDGAPAPSAVRPGEVWDFKALTASYERALVEAALEASAGHQGKAAEGLSLSYHQLRNLIKKHEISPRA
jgi:psp operon transcriptional activator